MNSNGLSYMNLLKAYFLLDLPSLLGINASHLFLSLLHKANSVGFKERLTIPNSTLQGMSGLHVPSSFHRTRQKLLSFQLDTKHIVKYTKARNVHQCGTYRIGYDVLLDSLPSYSQYGSETAHDMGVKPGVKLHTYTDKIRRDKKKEEVDNTIQSNKHCKELATLPPPSSANASELSEAGLDIITLINQLCATTWSPQRDIDADSLRELCDYPYDTAKWAIKTSRERKPAIRPPGIVTYALGVIRRYNEENQGDIQQKQGDGVLAEGVKELQDAYYWMDIAISGHKHPEIAYSLRELSQLTGDTIESFYGTYVPQGDDNYHTLEEYQQLYEEAQEPSNGE